MYRNHTVGVVIPAYNEERFVGDVIETVPDFVDRVYAVDDGSTDGTWAEITAAARRMNDAQSGPLANGLGEFGSRVVAIRHEQNRGVGGAIKTGYRRARDDRIDVTAVMGGDGQMRPSNLQAFLDPIVEGEADYTKGNRLADAETADAMPRFRLLGNRILTTLTKIASGYWGIGDPQNGYTAISLQALDAIDLGEMYEFYGYCNDLLVTLNVHGFRVADVPRPAIYADEESHITYSTYVPRVSAMLLRNFLWRLYAQYLRGGYQPTVSLYTAGILTGFVGALLAVIEAISPDRRRSTLANALRTATDGVALFGLATLLERRQHADRSLTIRRRPEDDGAGSATAETPAEGRTPPDEEGELEGEWRRRADGT